MKIRIFIFSHGPDISALNQFRIFVTMFKKHLSYTWASSTHMTTLPGMKTKFYFYEEILVSHFNKNLLIDSKLPSNVTYYLSCYFTST